MRPVEILLVLAACAGAAAATERPQPLLLPEDELIRRLDPDREWVMVAAAEYRAMLAAARAGRERAGEEPEAARAWTASGTVRAVLGEEHELHSRCELAVVARGVGPSRLRLFDRVPERIEAVRLDGSPAVCVRDGEALDVVVPGAGEHVLRCRWREALRPEGSGGTFAGGLSLPRAGSLDAALLAGELGHFAGPAIVGDERRIGDALAFALHADAGPTAAVRWIPGRRHDRHRTVLGSGQTLHVEAGPHGRELRFRYRLDLHRLHGDEPEGLRIVPPGGWIVHRYDAAVLRAVGDGGFAVRDPVGVVEVAGILAADARIDLPRIEGADWMGGRIALRVPERFRWRVPASWWVAGVGEYVVPGPGDGFVLAERALDEPRRVRAATSLAIDTRRVACRQVVEVEDRESLFALTVALPGGWRLHRVDGPDDLAIEREEDRDTGAVELRFPSGWPAGEPLRLMLEMLPAGERSPALEMFRPADVPGAEVEFHRLTVAASPGLTFELAARSPWRAVVPPRAHPDGGGLRELRCAGDPSPVRIVDRPRTVRAAVDLVQYFVPRVEERFGESWLRCDLRIAVHDGGLRELPIELPFAPDAELRYDETSFAVVAEDGRWKLVFLRPWRGERILRIAGPPAPRHLEELPAGALPAFADAAIDQRRWLAIQTEDGVDLTVDAADGLVPIDADHLPRWSRPIPGLAMSRSWRLPPRGGAGTYALVRPPLSARPHGFVDDCRVRIQVDRDGTLTLLRAVVAAPGIQELPVELPAGCELIRAAVDDREVAVRRADQGPVLALPGTTQCAIALLYRHRREAGPGDLEQSLPGLGGLPVLRARWEVAVAETLHFALPRDDAAIDLQLAAGRPSRRAFLGRRSDPTPAARGDDFPELRPAPIEDPRRLDDPGIEAPTGGPFLALRGVILEGERNGPGTLALALTPVEVLAWGDRVGLVLALLFAVIATIHCRLATAACLGCAAGFAAWALAGSGGGILQGFCEGFPCFLLACIALRWAVRAAWRWRHPAVALLLAVALSAAMPGRAIGAEPLLGTWEALDGAGQPTGIAFALTRDELARLREAAAGRVDAPAPPVDLAIGAVRYRLEMRDGVLRGRAEIPVVVFAEEWRDLVLPTAGASVGETTWIAADGEARSLAPRAGDGKVVIGLPPSSQGTVRLAVAFPGEGAIPIPAFAGLGGEGTVVLPDDLECRVDDRLQVRTDDEIEDGRATWRFALPSDAARAELRLPLVAATAAAGRLDGDFAQRIRIRAHSDRLDWEGTLAIAWRGGELVEFACVLPPELLIHEVVGEGLQAWNQDARRLVLRTGPDRRSLTLQVRGSLPLAGDGRREVAIAPPDFAAAGSRGRVGLLDGGFGRLRCEEIDALRRTSPGSGERIAYSWIGEVAAVEVERRREDRELAAVQRAAMAVGDEVVRVRLVCDLRGDGRLDEFALALPRPWYVRAVDGARATTLAGDGARRVALRAEGEPFARSSTVVVDCEATLEGLLASERFAPPSLIPLGDAVALQRQEWLIADRSDLRLEVAEADRAGSDAFRTLVRSFAGFDPGPDLQWRHALRRREGGELALGWRRPPPRVAAEIGNYLVLAGDRLRWSARIVATAAEGRIERLRLRLPEGATPVGVEATCLGGSEVADGVLDLRLATPVGGRVAVAVELRLPFDGEGSFPSLVLEDSRGPIRNVLQHVALVEDEVGIVHLDPQRLEEGDRAGGDAAILPLGVDSAQLRHRWRAGRDWSLGIRRESVEALGGADSVVKLLDAEVVLTPDGAQRGRVVWHLINRSRRQIGVAIGPGVEIWQARVRGREVRLRDDDGLAVPVPVLLPGEASIPVEVTWRAPAPGGNRLAIALPQLTDVRVVEGLVRVIPPTGYAIDRVDGNLRPVEPGLGAKLRSERVIDELAHLRKQGLDLGEAGLERLRDNLADLEQELADYNVDLAREMTRFEEAADGAGRKRGWAQDLESQMVLNWDNREFAQKHQAKVLEVVDRRAARRRALKLDRPRQVWEPAVVARGPGRHLAPAPLPLAWSVERTEPGGGLEVGEGPSGSGAGLEGRLIGIDLLAAGEADGTAFVGQGGDLRLVVDLERVESRWPGVLKWALAVLFLVAAGVLARRRRADRGEPAADTPVRK